jgi:arylsulfate sulfotransferase
VSPPGGGKVPFVLRSPLLLLVAAALSWGILACEAPTEDWAIEDLTVEDNPLNVLSCVVRWTTAVPATSRVEFGEEGVLQYFIEHEDLVTEHEIVVFGLHADSSHDLQAISVDAEAAQQPGEPLTYETGALPDFGVEFELTELREELAQPGWTLTNFVVDGILSPTIAVALDQDARVVWYHDMGPEPTFVDVDVTLTRAGRVLIGGDLGPGVSPVEVDFGGRVHWEGRPQPDMYLAPGTRNHTFRELPGGNHLTLTFDEIAGVVSDVIEEVTLDGEVVWSWDASDWVPEAAQQHIHGNMALVDGDHAWFNSLFLATFYKLDRTTGELLWALGEGGDFEPLGDHELPWVEQAHAPEIQPDGTILMYDNGIYPARPFSRVVQYELDEEAMTAAIVWEYPGDLADDLWFNSYWGDADRLDNGNTLITAGSVLEFDTTSTVFEVTADGQKAWQVMVLSRTDGGFAGGYGAERIALPLGVL